MLIRFVRHLGAPVSALLLASCGGGLGGSAATPTILLM
jgi:hypothetical protein